MLMKCDRSSFSEVKYRSAWPTLCRRSNFCRRISWECLPLVWCRTGTFRVSKKWSSSRKSRRSTLPRCASKRFNYSGCDVIFDIDVPFRFSETLVKIRNRHADVVPTIAKGVRELRESHEVDQTVEHRIHYFLDRFYMSRIGIRMLINQHSTLSSCCMKHSLIIVVFAALLFSEQFSNKRHIGCIDPNCSVQSVARDAYENARFLCDQYVWDEISLLLSLS